MKIIISIALVLFLVACSEEASTTSPQKEMVKQVSKAVKSVVSSPQAEEVKETAVVETTIDETIKVTLEETTEVTVSKSGAELFKACSSCHGLSGEKKALNKSQVIQGWSEIQVAAALNGYKDGSYGGAMKGLMKSQITKLSDEDISALSKHISGL